MKYTIKKEPTGYDFDMNYILEDENGVLFKIKNEKLREIYRFFTKNKEQAKDILSTYNDSPVPKEAIDFFVEETYDEAKAILSIYNDSPVPK